MYIALNWLPNTKIETYHIYLRLPNLFFIDMKKKTPKVEKKGAIHTPTIERTYQRINEQKHICMHDDDTFTNIRRGKNLQANTHNWKRRE